MKKILILGFQHGNELLGEVLYAYIKQHRSALLPYVSYKVGNPRAKKAGVRYIESDLNRSYNGGNDTYEEQRAKHILDNIKHKQYDLVIDAHTTTCQMPPCFITAELTGPTAEFMAASNISRVVHMPLAIASSSLIGTCPAAVSVEVNRHEITDSLLMRLCDGISNFIDDKRAFTQKTIYEIDGFIAKVDIDDMDVASLQNFQKSSHGYYPVLVGENSYKKQTNYLGFRASKVYQTKV